MIEGLSQRCLIFGFYCFDDDIQVVVVVLLLTLRLLLNIVIAAVAEQCAADETNAKWWTANWYNFFDASAQQLLLACRSGRSFWLSWLDIGADDACLSISLTPLPTHSKYTAMQTSTPEWNKIRCLNLTTWKLIFESLNWQWMVSVICILWSLWFMIELNFELTLW